MRLDGKFCIVLPMYNEAGNVMSTIECVNNTLVAAGLQADILCVNDGSVDATEQELVDAAHRWKNVIVRAHGRNQGFGVARWTGMQTAIGGGYTYAIFMDADMTMDPKYIVKFHEKMAAGFDFVIGSRFCREGAMLNVPLYRRLISFVANLIFRFCFRLKLSDYSQGFRAIRMSVIEQFSLKETGFPILIEELVQAKRITSKFAEVPFVLTGRRIGDSKFSYAPSVVIKYLLYAGKAFVATP